MKSPSRRPVRVRTFEQAAAFLRAAGVCYILADGPAGEPSLWTIVDLPDRRPGEKGWGAKVTAVWTWKNQLPADYPDEFFYGKTPQGKAVLMTLEHLRTVHYPQAHRPVTACSPLARKLYEVIRAEPVTTPELRRATIGDDRSRRTAFNKALVELQATLNIVRSNDPDVTGDTWLRFTELYPEFLDRT